MEGLDERLLGLVVLSSRLLGLVVGAGFQHLVPQDGRQLDGWKKTQESKVRNKGTQDNEKVVFTP